MGGTVATINLTKEKQNLLSEFAKQKRSFSDVEIGERLRKIDDNYQGKKFKKFVGFLGLLSLLIAPFVLPRNS